MRSNSYVRLPRNLHLADLDGDGADELIQVAGNRLLVTRVNPEGTGVLHAWFTEPITRLLTGRFTASGRIPGAEQVIVELGHAALAGYAASDDRQELWWWFSQPTFLRPDDQVVVADVDGDGRDDLLVVSASGKVRCYSPGDNGVFAPAATFAVGNLDREDLRGKLVLAGEFGQATGRKDLVVVDRRAGVLSRYDAATDAGRSTFWWAFSTATGVFAASEDICVANLAGGARDGLLVRHRATGTYRLLQVEHLGGHLGSVPGVSLGQLPVTPSRATVVAAKVKEAALRTAPGEAARHDVLLFDHRTGRHTRTDARHDRATNSNTYWYAFTGPTPTRDRGWPERTANDRWAVIRSKLSGTSKRGETDFYQRLFTRPGGGGMVDYFMDISYGAMDVSRSDVYPKDDRTEWYDCGYASGKTPRGPEVVDPFDDEKKEAREVIFGAAVRASGVNLRPYGHAVAVFNVANTAYGGAPDWVTVDPLDLGTAGIGQEMLHGYGLPHSLDAAGNQYGDPWDIMSAITSTVFNGFNGGSAGPDMNAPTKARMGFLPTSRVSTLRAGTPRRTADIRLAALNRPEAAGVLMVRVLLPNQSLTVEFRQRSFWDRNIPRDAVLVHLDAAGFSLLQANSTSADLVAGDSIDVAGVRVAVRELHGNDHLHDPWASTALIRLRY